MKAALLGNGPSRELYLKNVFDYDTVVGCNAPWTRVDWTVVWDKEVIHVWSKNMDLIKVPTYFSRDAWATTDAIKKRDLFQPHFAGFVQRSEMYDTSGHIACRLLIEHGYKEIDLYGFDSYWEDTIESISHDIFNNRSALPESLCDKWRKIWAKIQRTNKDVKLNFKR